MALLGGAALGGCLAGVASVSLMGPKPSAGAGAGEASQPANGNGQKVNAESYSSPRFPGMFASPGPGWRAFQSSNATKKGSATDLSKASLRKEPADFKCLGGLATELPGDAFVSTLEKLIGVSKQLQNNPRVNVHPQEKLACDIVMNELRPYSSEKGGPLTMEVLEYVKDRPSLKVTYAGTTDKTVSFVGSHFDVVPADAEGWNKDPFKLTIEGDKLFGRGTTDCLGHVALITQLLVQLGKTRPKLKHSIIVIFIAAEEGGEHGVGVDMVVKNGNMEQCKKGPVYWIDSADSNPCCGTCGSMTWSLTAKGRLFHSGFPHKGINSIELVSDAMAAVQERFYDDFPPHEKEELYQFGCGSNLKPTQVECKKGGLNQICPEATMHGDIRVSPFYDVGEVKSACERYVKDLNASLDLMPTRGPYSTYELGAEVEVQPGECRKGVLEWKWNGDLENMRGYEGIACNLDSAGHKALVQSVRETLGKVSPFSVNGSLPLVRKMQAAGFDIQMAGFGLMAVYHGIDEYCTMTDMKAGYGILLRIICLLEASV